MEDEILTKDEVIKKFKIGRFILDRAMREREIEYIKFGRKILFKKSAVEAWLLKNTVKVLSKDELKKLRRKKK